MFSEQRTQNSATLKTEKKKNPLWKYEMSNQDDHDNDGEMEERE